MSDGVEAAVRRFEPALQRLEHELHRLTAADDEGHEELAAWASRVDTLAAEPDRLAARESGSRTPSRPCAWILRSIARTYGTRSRP